MTHFATATLFTALIFVPAAFAENVEITSATDLDGVTNSYCIDIAGGNENIDITKGLQGHTCYSYRGSLGSDQTFDSAKFSENQLFMTDFNVCATLASLEAGAKVGLATCDGSDLQALVFSGEVTISPKAAPTMCLTLAADTRFGRDKKHQIKDMTLATCDEAQKTFQTWRVRKTDD
jgi:hypothetical protein